MAVMFDSETAEVLCTAAGSAVTVLREQAWGRTESVRLATLTFAGDYAELFTRARGTEREDRVALASALEHLCSQITVVSSEAASERQRRADRAAWEVRETQRERDRALAPADLSQAIRDVQADLFDPEPSDVPGRPTPICADFSARMRVRSGASGSGGGRTSADPDALREFITTSTGLDGVLDEQLSRVSASWRNFSAECTWAKIESISVLPGFEAYLRENREDTRWIDAVATAFEQAGGESLMNLCLDVAATGLLPDAFASVLLPGLTAAEVAAAWVACGMTAADILGLPLARQYQLANLNGVPAVSRDIASRAVMNYPISTSPNGNAVVDPAKEKELYQLTGLEGSDLNLEDFATQLDGLRAGLKEADRAAKKIAGSPGNQVAQLVGLGVHDGALTAAIVLGNLDIATNVTVNVPGATTTVGDAPSNVKAATELMRAANGSGSTDPFAVVSWFGYRTPSAGEALYIDRAESGGRELSSFLDAFVDGRPSPPEHVTIIAHSYGSTVAAEALSDTRHRVDSLVNYGSAGFDADIRIDDLMVDRVFATEADADGTADFGRFFGRTDPRDLDGVTKLSSEADQEISTVAVTGHDMHPTAGVGYLSFGSTSLRAIADIVRTGRA